MCLYLQNSFSDKLHVTRRLTHVTRSVTYQGATSFAYHFKDVKRILFYTQGAYKTMTICRCDPVDSGIVAGQLQSGSTEVCSNVTVAMNDVLKLILIVLSLPFLVTIPLDEEFHARVVLSGESSVKGVLHLRQTVEGFSIEGRVTGLSPGKHGFHIHQWGDLSNGCDSTGPHFNPEHVSLCSIEICTPRFINSKFEQAKHGGVETTSRHLGDLGNIEADEEGMAEIRIMDHHLTLAGPNSIVGRAYVIHSATDDLGKGANEASKINGNAGTRIACGIIGLVP